MSRLVILPKSIDVTLVIFCAALARVGLFWGGFSVAQRCVCHPSGDSGILVPSVNFPGCSFGLRCGKEKKSKQDWYFNGKEANLRCAFTPATPKAQINWPLPPCQP